MRMSYEYVSTEVDKLYEKKIENKDLHDHISLIKEFINVCGWTEDEFFDRQIKDDLN